MPSRNHLQNLAQQIGFTPKKSLGQNFVTEKTLVEKIVRLAEVSSSDTVLEIGPGFGSLTEGLLQAGATVIALEIDEKLYRILPKILKEKLPTEVHRLQLYHFDAMKLKDWGSFTDVLPNKLISNLPYRTGVPLLLKSIIGIPSLRQALIMVQLEVARRLVAKAGSKDYGIPSLKLSHYGRAKIEAKVSGNCFYPKPGVDSALVSWTRDECPKDQDLTRGLFNLIDWVFSQRRKMLRTTLTSYLRQYESKISDQVASDKTEDDNTSDYSATGKGLNLSDNLIKEDNINDLLDKISQKVDLSQRPEDLDLPEFIEIVKLISAASSKKN